jgi:DNA-binding CsgD family transcriptional regulator
MSADTGAHDSRRSRGVPDPRLRAGRQSHAGGGHRQPAWTRDGPDSPGDQVVVRRLEMVFEVLDQWAELSQHPWQIAFLLVLADGPASRAEACTSAAAWAEGQLVKADLGSVLADMHELGLVVCLGGTGDDAVVALTSAGGRMLDQFADAAERLSQSPQLVAFAETCLLHARLLELTATESQILSLVVSGHTDHHIAQTLRLSRRTVASHVDRILATLHIRSRNALIARLTIEGVEC